MELRLNSIRLVEHDQAEEFMFGEIEKMEENMAIAFINPKDFEEMYLTKSLKLHLFNEHGEVVVRFEQDENIPKGTIAMPVSIWSNQLTSTKDGKLLNKNIPVNCEASRDPPTKLTELIEKIKKGGDK
jgi:formylmethanofuran dehydrogenase subunit D